MRPPPPSVVGLLPEGDLERVVEGSARKTNTSLNMGQAERESTGVWGSLPSREEQ